MINLEKINKKYGEHSVVKDFNLTVEQSEMVAITGKSDCGKTTILNIIGLLDEIDSGRIVINNYENPKFNSKIGRRLLNEDVGFIFQNFALVDDYTVLENFKIATANSKVVRDEIEKALKFVGMDGVTTRKVYTLSGGEQQRIAIAKILLKKPKIILADEPTGSLDEENRDIVLGLLKELNNQGVTIIIVTHDKYIASICNREVKL